MKKVIYLSAFILLSVALSGAFYYIETYKAAHRYKYFQNGALLIRVNKYTQEVHYQWIKGSLRGKWRKQP